MDASRSRGPGRQRCGALVIYDGCGGVTPVDDGRLAVEVIKQAQRVVATLAYEGGLI
ncbi:UNVERIFIED_CONTAM: hypothetical protein Sangu_1760700 [Sesamum angustifolium]|uniref:Uncharacterized protein n=1 Tax=Sesamum angustifolium TaxID=2727405 RepID=A0AAW2M6R1_9LAMI